MKKIIAIVLTAAMLFSVMAFGAAAYTINKDDGNISAGEILGTTAVYFEDAEVGEGEDVTVDLMFDGNPGVTKIVVTLALPDGLDIASVENGDLGTASVEGNVITVSSDTVLNADGCIAKITFTGATAGEKTVVITATGERNTATVAINGSDCIVKVISDSIPGDVNGDGDVDTTDLANLKIFLATEEVTEDIVNPDVDGNGVTNVTDLAVLKLALAE